MSERSHKDFSQKSLDELRKEYKEEELKQWKEFEARVIAEHEEGRKQALQKRKEMLEEQSRAKEDNEWLENLKRDLKEQRVEQERLEEQRRQEELRRREEAQSKKETRFWWLWLIPLALMVLFIIGVWVCGIADIFRKLWEFSNENIWLLILNIISFPLAIFGGMNTFRGWFLMMEKDGDKFGFNKNWHASVYILVTFLSFVAFIHWIINF
jgi:cation transport ATPase